MAEPGPSGASGRAVAAWLLFDFATQPFYTLITTFVFAPFFAARIAADPVSGQSLWGYAASGAGLLIAVASPLLGAVADASGRRKRWIALFSVMLVAGSAALWFAVPGTPGAVVIALAAFALATIGAEFATVFTNAMMPDLVSENRLGRLSGTGWAVGYVGGLLGLVIVLGFLAADPGTGLTLLGLPAILGLDPASHAGDRASGPFSALWYLVFVLPLFLAVPDQPYRRPIAAAMRQGLADLAETFRQVRVHRNVVRFLIAHMVYADGLVALFTFGGIYAVGVFDWSTVELGLFGIFLTVTGTVGALIGGRLDDRLGALAVICGALAVLILASVAVLSVEPGRVAFLVDVAPPVPGDGLFASAGERFYLVFGGLIGLAAGPLQAASRSLMVRIAPPRHMTQFFGLFAMSGKLTSFSAPLAVAVVTAMSGSQRIGIAMLILFFVVGGLLLLRVTPARA